jgi:hypothetical protein
MMIRKLSVGKYAGDFTIVKMPAMGMVKAMKIDNILMSITFGLYSSALSP